MTPTARLDCVCVSAFANARLRLAAFCVCNRAFRLRVAAFDCVCFWRLAFAFGLCVWAAFHCVYAGILAASGDLRLKRCVLRLRSRGH